jgi:SAM-dependent methyltransferase
MGYLKLLGVVEPFVPRDHSEQVTSEWYVDHLWKEGHCPHSVLDLGCGAGNSLDLFRKYDPNIAWVGLDIENSPEVQTRKLRDANFATYDGTHIPFADNTFDLIYCKQVLEHVRYPQRFMSEAARVLRPKGCLIGSTSHLEPYHSYSYWNYTPYGFSVIAGEAGLRLLEIRPSIDALSMLFTHVWQRFPAIWWEHESPVNLVISLLAGLRKVHPQSVNALKLLFCGQFCFWASKPE